MGTYCLLHLGTKNSGWVFIPNLFKKYLLIICNFNIIETKIIFRTYSQKERNRDISLRKIFYLWFDSFPEQNIQNIASQCCTSCIAVLCPVLVPLLFHKIRYLKMCKFSLQKMLSYSKTHILTFSFLVAGPAII